MREYKCAICGGKMKYIGDHHIILEFLYEDDSVAYICLECQQERWKLTEEQQELYQCVVELEQIKKREEELGEWFQTVRRDKDHAKPTTTPS